ncbi:DUF4232 domain-containing protein [Streptomyces sp. Ru73]|uniref:DUF4232 domain-containing protein n=1 Tax=Streptomyces sp. Ru73 TaxID=2080748 RepID=UPI0021564A45|nr:DUF4232 domain-containing protein [Streptomyces sp. Ru73]
MSHQTGLRRGRRAATATLIAAAAAVALTACDAGAGTQGAGSGSGAGSSASSAAPSSAGSSAGAENGGNGGSGGQDASQSASQGATQGTSKAPAGAGGATVAQTASARTAASASSDTSANRCTADELGLRLGREDVGAGNIHIPLVFTNKGKSACTLTGFPGVSLIQRDGQMIGKPATREGAAGKPVTLKPGGSAYAVLHTIQDGLKDTPCWKSPYLLQTYPPGSKEAMTLRTSSPRVCGGEFTVTALEPGTGL